MKTPRSFSLHLALLPCFALLLSACASGPPPPDWQVEAKGAMERSIAAYMQGNSRVEGVELARARSQLARTGRADLLATAELMRCASRVASLVFESCTAFEHLRPDVSPAQSAYAAYLQGQITPSSIDLLPPAQRASASATTFVEASALKEISDPLSQLLAAAVLLKTGKASPAVMAQAADTASNQGWRRPLLAWLGVQVQYAEQQGELEEAARLRRRIHLVEGAELALKPVTKEVQ
ncbi:hypothetical protein AwPolaro_09250 [Polaromonas sp.]|nr:hypothetical protein AwPolaro_09250 [Polaromonas sp.]